MTEAHNWIAEVQALHLEDGDVIAVRVNRRLTVEQAAAIQEQVRTLAPGHAVAVLPPEIEVRVLELDAGDGKRWQIIVEADDEEVVRQVYYAASEVGARIGGVRREVALSWERDR